MSFSTRIGSGNSGKKTSLNKRTSISNNYFSLVSMVAFALINYNNCIRKDLTYILTMVEKLSVFEWPDVEPNDMENLASCKIQLLDSVNNSLFGISNLVHNADNLASLVCVVLNYVSFIFDKFIKQNICLLFPQSAI